MLSLSPQKRGFSALGLGNNYSSHHSSSISTGKCCLNHLFPPLERERSCPLSISYSPLEDFLMFTSSMSMELIIHLRKILRLGSEKYPDVTQRAFSRSFARDIRPQLPPSFNEKQHSAPPCYLARLRLNTAIRSQQTRFRRGASTILTCRVMGPAPCICTPCNAARDAAYEAVNNRCLNIAIAS